MPEEEPSVKCHSERSEESKESVVNWHVLQILRRSAPQNDRKGGLQDGGRLVSGFTFPGRMIDPPVFPIFVSSSATAGY